jgi:hypothetical protein
MSIEHDDIEESAGSRPSLGVTLFVLGWAAVVYASYLAGYLH